VHFINAHKEQGIRAAQAEAYDDYTSRRVELYAEYEAQCQREGRGRFRRTAAALLRAAAAQRAACAGITRSASATSWSTSSRTPTACSTWLKLLARQRRERGGLFAVGDDDQSIYAFRGAESATCATSSASSPVPNVIRLEQNYRSHGNILDAANALIKQQPRPPRQEPVDRSRRRRADPRPSRPIPTSTRRASSSRRSANWCATAFRATRSPCSTARTRSRGCSSTQLFTPGVPYRVYGGLRFFERQEIKHALAYLRLIANPDDDTAFAAWSISRRAASARAASRPAGSAHRPIPASTTPPRVWPARPAARSRISSA
jgi:DNA helicase-2/ATP-dependent DNA helicase PcrA